MQFLTGLLCGAIFGLAAIVPSAYGQTRFIPSLAVSEAYDTNIFFITSGGNLQDYVTTITPQIRGEHKSRLLDAAGQISLPASLYVRNPGLNYVSVSTSINVGLDQLTSLVDKRWKLSVAEFVTYTPQPPAFFSPTPAGGTGTTASATDLSAPSNFIRGVQAVRANSLINVASINSRYVFTPVTSLTGSIQHQYMQFGTAFAPAPGQGFFTTHFATISTGPQFQFTPRDTVNVNFNYSHMSFSQPNGFSSGFDLQGGKVGWSRTFTPKLSANATGGFTIFSGSTNLQYLASGQITYQERNTSFIGSYSRSIFPSFFIAATPLLSQVVSASVVHRFTAHLSANGALNYAKNEAIGSTQLQFDSYSGSAGLNYAFSKTWSISANYTHMVIKNAFNGTNFDFNRDVVSVSLRKEWPDFFQPK
ncbi:MAG: outer membrane beta-barrel protein [Nitrospirales bacterium]|nr:outer membrane beta-barrel protein [Nitrospirales bacterium]